MFVVVVCYKLAFDSSWPPYSWLLCQCLDPNTPVIFMILSSICITLQVAIFHQDNKSVRSFPGGEIEETDKAPLVFSTTGLFVTATFLLWLCRTDRLTDWQTGRLTDWLWRADRLTEVGSIVRCLHLALQSPAQCRRASLLWDREKEWQCRNKMCTFKCKYQCFARVP